jgi:oligoendopeptidase F
MPLARLRKQASERMSPEEESLGSDLGINGLGAWSRLYFSLMGNLRFTMEDPEMGTVEKPVAQLNSLLADQNAERRKAASAGAALTFSEHRVTCAAAINAISGTRLTLNQRRSVKHFLEPSCFQSAISTETLEALMQAVDSRLPFAREVFQFRSKKLGIEKPGFLDLRAPLPADASAKLDWASATTLVSNAFNKVYPALGAFFDELIEKCWVDHTPRDGKRPGGFCTGSLMTRQSRIFMTYNATLNDVLTLAHEAGHAWHSRVLKDQRPLRSGYPMTLAETASTLAERVLTQGIMDDPQSSATTRLHLLDAEIEHGLAFLLDLPVRFRFERRLYELRANGQLSAEELCSLMRETQIEVFGGAMDPDGADPWFWVAKLHFYIEQVQFYNYPYTFGFLLSLAFMDGIREDPVSGISAYEAFLAESGSQSCEDVVKATLGADIADPAFWEARIDSLRTPFAHYKDLLQ